MSNLSDYDNKVNTNGMWAKVGDWYQRKWWDIAIFLLIFLGILAVIGYIHLRQLSPQKQPVRFEYAK